MKTNFSLKFKLFDVFILAFATIVIVASLIATNIVYADSLSKNNSSVLIYHNGNIIQEINMKDVNEQETIVLKQDEYEDLLGDVTILIDTSKGIRILEVTCPNHTCEKQGWVKRAGVPIVCLPNDIYVIINSKNSNEDIILG